MQRHHAAGTGCFVILTLLGAGCSGGPGTSSGADGNEAPIANAGLGRAVTVQSELFLSGAQSRDPEGAKLSYKWRLVTKPSGSLTALGNAETINPTIRPDRIGPYVVELVVSDGNKDSDPSLVTITADSGANLRVGPGRSVETPSQAAAQAKDGDVITIDASVYPEDVAVWRQNDLTIRGVGGYAHLRADGASAQRKAIWVIQGRNMTIEGIEFSGATVKDKNGAGIRHEGTGLTVRKCYFHDNENGILVAPNSDNVLLIEHCEFARNGYGDGLSHNIYVNDAKSLTFQFNYSHHTKRGHNLKSRARINYVLYNRIMDELEGNASYAIDMPNAGLGFVVGNQLQQGPRTDNSSMLAYGAEGYKYATNELYVVNNTFVNDRSSGTFVRVWGNPGRAVLQNNLFAGNGRLLDGPGNIVANVTTATPSFVAKQTYDYRLMPGSKAIDAGSNPGSARGFSLEPKFEYQHPAGKVARHADGRLDVGAFERTQ